MRRFGLWAIGSILLFSWSVSAQQPAAGSERDQLTRSAAENGVPSAESQLKILTAKLDLSADQQSKMKRILDELHEGTMKIVEAPGLSHEERLERVRPLRYKARDQMRAILNDDQKQKLDEYLQGPHAEMHGNLQ